MPDDRAHSMHLAERVTLRPAEAALALGLSERTLRTLMKRREVPFFHIGGAVLFRVEALRAWAEQREQSESGREVAPPAIDAPERAGAPAIANGRRAEVEQHTRALASRMSRRLGVV